MEIYKLFKGAYILAPLNTNEKFGTRVDTRTDMNWYILEKNIKVYKYTYNTSEAVGIYKNGSDNKPEDFICLCSKKDLQLYKGR